MTWTRQQEEDTVWRTTSGEETTWRTDSQEETSWIKEEVSMGSLLLQSGGFLLLQNGTRALGLP